VKLVVDIARTRAAILRCQYLIAETYNRAYDIVFSDDRYDLEAKIEPWPHRYLMGTVDGEPVAAVGLYLRDTYVTRFGAVGDDDVAASLREADAFGRYRPHQLRELTKLVVHADARGGGLARAFLAIAHARAFVQLDAESPHLLVTCAKRTIWENFHDRLGIRTRLLKPFPLYRVHELYRSEADPMDSRLIIPDLDIPQRLYGAALPAEVIL
jgi:GNAT superfamily N-acetyltransferase